MPPKLRLDTKGDRAPISISTMRLRERSRSVPLRLTRAPRWILVNWFSARSLESKKEERRGRRRKRKRGRKKERMRKGEMITEPK